MEINVPFPPIKALLHLAGKADIRPWVNGVWLDFEGPTVIVVASDGGVLGAYLTDEPSVDSPPVFIPRHIVEAAAKGAGPHITLMVDDSGNAAVKTLAGAHYWRVEDLKCYDFRRVLRSLPLNRQGDKPHQLNPNNLVAFMKCREAFPKVKKIPTGGVLVAHNSGDSAGHALVTLIGVGNFVGVLTALNEKSKDLEAEIATMARVTPDWVGKRTSKAAPKVTTVGDLV